MAYIALPTRDSSFILLANAAPRLPRSVTASASCSLLDAVPVRPIRMHSSSLFGGNVSSNVIRRGCRVFASAEGSVSVEDPVSTPASEEQAPAEGGAPAAEGTASAEAPKKTFGRTNTIKRQSSGAKREITVTNEQLVPGAVFTGKVRAVQTYGAFVDIGAFTDGLVHISQLSSEYVKEVSEVVKVGQEVSVTVMELNEKTGRIALSMRDKESETEQQSSRSGGESSGASGTQGESSGKPMNRGKIAGRGSGNARSSSRSNDDRKATKLKKGQELKGTVKNIIRNGAFIEFPEEGEEGFLRGSEIQEGGENVAVDTLLTVGQEVTVRVLKIEKGKAALTMKPQVDMSSINDSLNTNVGAGGASNPFATFFRAANMVPAASPSAPTETAAEPATAEEMPAPAAVDETSALEAASEAAVDPEETPAPEAADETPAVEAASEPEETPAADETSAVEAASEAAVDPEETPAPVAADETPAVEAPSEPEESPAVEAASKPEETPAADETSAVEAASEAAVDPEETPAPEAADETPAVEAASEPEETPAADETSAVEAASEAAVDPEETPAPAAVDETPAVEAAPEVEETPAPAVVDETPAGDEAPSTEAAQSDEGTAVEDRKDDSAKTEEPHSLSLPEIAENIGGAVHDIEKVVEAAAENVGGAVTEVEKVVEAAADFFNGGGKDEAPAVESSPEPSTEATEAKAEEQQPEPEASKEPEIVAEAAPEAPVVEEPKAAAAPVDEKPAAAAAASGPSAKLVKELREKSGAGMMECKKALLACDNDLAKAGEYLRKKGLAGADKKASRIAAEGRVGSYVHDGRMGVLVEVNCETDFVARGTQFKELVTDMGMQVVACPDVRYVSVDDVPADFVQKEKEIEMGKEDLANKPEQIREKIVDGRITKRLAELALLEQSYIRDESGKVPVKDHVKEMTAKLGEKISIRRFVRFNLGEGLQKKSVDFAAEVAAQTHAKEPKPAAAEAPKVEEAPKADEAPKVAVSAATVKELRDSTGAGMMECKKALAACENDVAKATDYLRKKGLASADKKSGRVASEGLIGSYIHDGRIGVLVEVNSETDFVARSAEFKELVQNIAMQVAACPQVQFVTVEEIPAEFVEKEKEIEMGKEDLQKRPEAVRSKIVEGRVAKTLNELVLVEQPYIRDDKILVKDYVKQVIAALGENIQVRRFARFNMGEGIEKRSTDFAAEVAAQTGGAKA